MLLREYLCVSKHIGHIFNNHRASFSSKLSTYSSPIKVAIVGSGPAGFYTTQKLLKNPQITVDIFEKLPVPFGLVRYGVAPDHAEVKNVINTFTTVANNNRVNFFGNINLGKTIGLENLLNAYHAVVLCYGSAQDKLLNIDGELTSMNTISARNFVGWYNGVPEDKDLKINLDCDTACIIGQGNVALDCARILLKPANLEKTDITLYSQQMIAKSKIRRLYIIGRRGPVQASFTTKELREIIKLNKGRTRIEPENVFQNLTFMNIRNLSRQRRRLTELMLNTSMLTINNSDHENGVELIFKFFSKPRRIITDQESRYVRSLEVQKTQFANQEDLIDESALPVDTEDYENIDCGLIIRSIGYKAVMVDISLPMDNKNGSILNTNGRVHGHRNLYCSGWLATGASGVIAGTLNSSHVTAQSLLDDIQRKDLPNMGRSKQGFDEIRGIIDAKSVQIVRFNDWMRIDELERRLGETLGKTREKFVDIDKILEIVDRRNKQ